MNRHIRNAVEYAKLGFRYFVLQSDGPFFLGLLTNDVCNLNCIDCRVANIHGEYMSFDDICRVLERYYQKGVRFLYLAGGEPYLWRDGDLRLRDVVTRARDIGYLNVQIYTNGTITMDAGADLTFISIDGAEAIFQRIRGIPIERVLRKVRKMQDPHAITCVINSLNYREIPDFLEFCERELPGRSVVFYFHTPYYGIDDLYLSQAERREAVASILECKRRGFPVLNSRVALDFYLAGNPGLPVNHWWLVDTRGEYRCCRFNDNPDLCRDCGYTSCGELIMAQKGRPGAIHALLKTRAA